MPVENSQPTQGSQPAGSPDGGQSAGALTPELVNKVAEKVYAMLLLDLKIERERRRTSSGNPWSGQGGTRGS